MGVINIKHDNDGRICGRNQRKIKQEPGLEEQDHHNAELDHVSQRKIKQEPGLEEQAHDDAELGQDRLSPLGLPQASLRKIKEEQSTDQDSLSPFQSDDLTNDAHHKVTSPSHAHRLMALPFKKAFAKARFPLGCKVLVYNFRDRTSKSTQREPQVDIATMIPNSFSAIVQRVGHGCNSYSDSPIDRELIYTVEWDNCRATSSPGSGNTIQQVSEKELLFALNTPVWFQDSNSASPPSLQEAVVTGHTFEIGFLQDWQKHDKQIVITMENACCYSLQVTTEDRDNVRYGVPPGSLKYRFASDAMCGTSSEFKKRKASSTLENEEAEPKNEVQERSEASAANNRISSSTADSAATKFKSVKVARKHTNVPKSSFTISSPGSNISEISTWTAACSAGRATATNKSAKQIIKNTKPSRSFRLIDIGKKHNIPHALRMLRNHRRGGVGRHVSCRCLPWHLSLQCDTECNRANDHQTLSEQETQSLERALEPAIGENGPIVAYYPSKDPSSIESLLVLPHEFGPRFLEEMVEGAKKKWNLQHDFKCSIRIESRKVCGEKWQLVARFFGPELDLLTSCRVKMEEILHELVPTNLCAYLLFCLAKRNNHHRHIVKHGIVTVLATSPQQHTYYMTTLTAGRNDNPDENVVGFSTARSFLQAFCANNPHYSLRYGVVEEPQKQWHSGDWHWRDECTIPPHVWLWSYHHKAVDRCREKLIKECLSGQTMRR